MQISGTMRLTTTYYFFGGARIAMRVGETVTYLHGDRLGSASLATDAAGNVLSQERYYVWGSASMMSDTMPTDFQWQNQRRLDDSQTGKLYDFNARFFTPVAARFISPDSIVPNPVDPQSLNRYTAMANNPLKFADPTGHAEISPRDDSACWNCAAWPPVVNRGMTYWNHASNRAFVSRRLPSWWPNKPYNPRSYTFHFFGSAVPAKVAPGFRPWFLEPNPYNFTPYTSSARLAYPQASGPSAGAGGATPGFVGFETEVSGPIADYDALLYRTKIDGRMQIKAGPYQNDGGVHATNDNFVSGPTQLSYGGVLEIATITGPEMPVGPWRVAQQFVVGFGPWGWTSWKQYLGYEAVYSLVTDKGGFEMKTGIKQQYESRPWVGATTAAFVGGAIVYAATGNPSVFCEGTKLC